MVDEYRGGPAQTTLTAAQTSVPVTRQSPEQAAVQEPGDTDPAEPTRPRIAGHQRRRVGPRAMSWSNPVQIAAEAFVSLATAFGFLLACRGISVNPMVRVGQVSGMAQLQFRFAIVAIALVAAVLIGERLLSGRARRWLEPLACAITAGLFSGLVAAGIGVALEGTPYGLWAGQGDYVWIGQWATSIIEGNGLPAYHYPPLSIYALAGWADLTGQPVEYAMKDLQLFGTALFGPATYLAWRLLMRPALALGIGVVAMIPFLEPVKAYPQLTLVVMVGREDLLAARSPS